MIRLKKLIHNNVEIELLNFKEICAKADLPYNPRSTNKKLASHFRIFCKIHELEYGLFKNKYGEHYIPRAVADVFIAYYKSEERIFLFSEIISYCQEVFHLEDYNVRDYFEQFYLKLYKKQKKEDYLLDGKISMLASEAEHFIRLLAEYYHKETDRSSLRSILLKINKGNFKPSGVDIIGETGKMEIISRMRQRRSEFWEPWLASLPDEFKENVDWFAFENMSMQMFNNFYSLIPKITELAVQFAAENYTLSLARITDKINDDDFENKLNDYQTISNGIIYEKIDAFLEEIRNYITNKKLCQ